MATADDDLGRFLLELLPEEAKEGLRRLAELRYPIPDRRSLAEQLGAGDEADRRADAGLLGAFDPEDFGLDTLQSALEKYRARRPWTLAGALPLDAAAARTLAGAVAGGGLQVERQALVARMRAGATVEVDCSCTDPDAGGTGAPGTCKMIVSGSSLICTNDTCKKTCGLTVTIPSIGLLMA
jgi:hypothetical protein